MGQRDNPYSELERFRLKPNTQLGSLLGGIGASPAVRLGIVEPKRRRAFFSFHYKDVIRVNNVRKCFGSEDRSSGFFDASLWERKKLENDDAVKNLIRDGVHNTSAVCVLVGTETFQRRWVKYEIARSVIDERGLLAVHINGLNHHERRAPDPRGFNPLQHMGVYRAPNGNIYLAEAVWVQQTLLTGHWEWKAYGDYISSVPVPNYMPLPVLGGAVIPLSAHTVEYDYAAQNGSKNIGGWIDLAAQRVNR